MLHILNTLPYLSETIHYILFKCCSSFHGAYTLQRSPTFFSIYTYFILGMKIHLEREIKFLTLHCALSSNLVVGCEEAACSMESVLSLYCSFATNVPFTRENFQIPPSQALFLLDAGLSLM